MEAQRTIVSCAEAIRPLGKARGGKRRHVTLKLNAAGWLGRGKTVSRPVARRVNWPAFAGAYSGALFLFDVLWLLLTVSALRSRTGYHYLKRTAIVSVSS